MDLPNKPVRKAADVTFNDVHGRPGITPNQVGAGASSYERKSAQPFGSVDAGSVYPDSDVGLTPQNVPNTHVSE